MRKAIWTTLVLMTFASSSVLFGQASWELDGNSGTGSGDFLGTTDNEEFRIHIYDDNAVTTDGTGRVALFEPRTGTTASPNIIFGYRGNNSGLTTVKGAAIGGGGYNGQLNEVTAHFGTIGGGYGNTVSGQRGTVGGGNENTASHYSTTVGGGYSNVSSSNYSTVGGGRSNTSSGYNGTIGGGRSNTSSGSYSTVAGGSSNTASYSYAAVVGGYSNSSSGSFSIIGGGYNNDASSSYTTVGGGKDNESSDSYATVGGGSSNTVSKEYGTVSGGRSNTSSGSYATVGGGQSNSASGGGATIAGGFTNSTSGIYSTIGGGFLNVSSNHYTVVGGGQYNEATGPYATILGGYTNEASGEYSSIYSGLFNTVSGACAVVGGGRNNEIEGDYSVIPGGRELLFDETADHSFGFLAASSSSENMTISESNVAVFGNADLWLANNDNSARQLRFYEAQDDNGAFPASGTYYTSFESPALSGTIEYILPATKPASVGDVLKVSAISGDRITLEWDADDIGASSFKDAGENGRGEQWKNAQSGTVDSDGFEIELKEKDKRIQELEERIRNIERTLNDVVSKRALSPGLSMIVND